MFGKTEILYQGSDMAQFNQIRAVLEQAGIRYDWDVNDRLARWAFPGRGTIRSCMGSAGAGSGQPKEYRIRVKTGDFDKAQWIIRRL